MRQRYPRLVKVLEKLAESDAVVVAETVAPQDKVAVNQRVEVRQRG